MANYPAIYEHINNLLWLVLLIFGRFFGVLSIFVLFAKRLPTVLKTSLALILAITVTPYFSNVVLPTQTSVNSILLVKEVFYGGLIGYLLSLPIWMIEAIGNIIDLQRGEQLGAIVNQLTNNPDSSIAKLISQVFIVYFVSCNGLLFMLDVTFKSFTIVGVDKLVPKFTSFAPYIDLFNSYFYWVVILGLPIISIMFLLELILGLISSFIPQLNVTVISMPLKSALALFALILYLSTLLHQVMDKFVIQIKNFPF